MSFLPSLRIARPVLSMLHKSLRLGSSISGGVVASASAMTFAIFPNDCANSGYFAASFWENAEISWADLPTS